MPGMGGFHFPNRFPAVPAWTLTIPAIGEIGMGNAANGLCGGMVFAARDFFEFGVAPRRADLPPSGGSPLFRYIVDQLLASFDLPLGPARYYEWIGLSSPAIAGATRAAWPAVRAQLDDGRPAPLALVRAASSDPRALGRNHQVLAYGYRLEETIGALTLDLYDPNHPDTAVTLTCNLGQALPLNLTYSTSEPTRGFFLTPYSPADPRFLISAVALPPPWWSQLVGRWLSRR